MGLGGLLVLTKAICSLKLTFFIQQVFFECMPFARPHLVTQDSKYMQTSPSGSHLPVGEQAEEEVAGSKALWPLKSAVGAMPTGAPGGASVGNAARRLLPWPHRARWTPGSQLVLGPCLPSPPQPCLAQEESENF